VHFVEQRLQDTARQLKELSAKEELETRTRHERHRRRLRAFELAKARVLEFAGASDLQMQLAGRRTGVCYICGKDLTDPISLERGIGPDCVSNKINFIRDWAQRARDAGRFPPVDLIRLYSGMPRDFVIAVIDQMKEGAPRSNQQPAAAE
jgi:hypothetical protein